MEAVRLFFSAPRYAVAGASNDANKFGYKSGREHSASSFPDLDRLTDW